MTAQAELEHLIERVSLGDKDALSELYDRTSTKLFSLCLRVLKERSEAEDVLQEVYLKIWRNAAKYRVNGLSPMTWLITLTRNTAIDRLRSQKTDLGRQEEMPDVPDTSPGPEDLVLSTHRQRDLERCLDTLPHEKSEAVKAAYLDGQRYADLAERYAIPLNTMRTWLRRSLISLRECMKQ